MHPKEIVDAETRIALRQTTTQMEQLVCYVEDTLAVPKGADRNVIRMQIHKCKVALKWTYKLLERA
jgi:hypothetical protein